MNYYFPHEKLDCYQLARQVARWLATASFESGDADIRNQAIRAARSTVLNIAEASGRYGKSRRYHFSIALGSAAETCAALDLVDIEGAAEQQELLRRVGIMLQSLQRM